MQLSEREKEKRDYFKEDLSYLTKTDFIKDFDFDYNIFLECPKENSIQSINTNYMNESHLQLTQANSFNNMLHPDNSTQFNSIFSRNLSEFLNTNLEVAPTATNTQRTVDSEKTIDLSAILLQDQGSYRKTMPISDLLSNNQLTTIGFNAGQKAQVHNENSTISYDDSEDDTCDFDAENSRKRKAAGNIRRNAKRLSTTSTNSSAFSGENTNNSDKGTGRGGKRSNRSILTDEENLARFGNKYVPKGTDEYNQRRNKNNDAVKKCRAKLQMQQEEREKRLKELSEENRKLSNTVESLNKELSVLKGILSTMKPQCSLPSDIEEKIRKLENLVLANSVKA